MAILDSGRGTMAPPTQSWAPRRAPPRLAKKRPAASVVVGSPRPSGPGHHHGHARATRSSSRLHHPTWTGARNADCQEAPPPNADEARPIGRKRGLPPSISHNAAKRRPRCNAPAVPALDSRPEAGSPVTCAALATQRSPEKDLGRRLPWSDLPYMILVDVFSFASAPLDNSASVGWLLAASTVCRAFAEPALTVLYRSPPLLNMAMAHGLLDLLALPPSDTGLNYRQKIESLKIDAGLVASLTYKGRHLDVEALVRHCPRLVDLDFYHQKDMSPYRQLDDRLRWAYPAGLFSALQAESTATSVEDRRSPTFLRSWRWSARMMGPDISLETMKSIHESRSFATLRKIMMVNYQRPSLNIKNVDDAEIVAMDKAHATEFADLLRALPELRHLVLESCTMANEHLLPLLPKTLAHLELINCWDITADMLSEFLVSHGHDLRHLTLHHNQSLSLSFLPLLGTCCPNLESLRMNLTYYKHHASYNDAQPIYDELLLPDQVPVWPRSIRVVEIENMRKWNPEAAEVFFRSFIDCAPNMPDLRRLSFKAMLDIPWRQRSAIREEWEVRLKTCFARNTTEPRPWRCVADIVAQREVDADQRRLAKRRPPSFNNRPSRRSGRLATQVSEQSSRSSSVARGLRRLGRGHVSYREPDSDEDLDDEEGGLSDDEKFGTNRAGSISQTYDDPSFVHGLCDVVDIRFDNQKPTEMQFGMEDFLDQEDVVSDEDWDGDLDGDDENYAW